MFRQLENYNTVQFGSKYRGGNFIINEGNTGKLKKIGLYTSFNCEMQQQKDCDKFVYI